MGLPFSQRTICSHNVAIHLMVIRASALNLLLHVLAGRAEYTETWTSPYIKSEVTACTSWAIKVLYVVVVFKGQSQKIITVY